MATAFNIGEIGNDYNPNAGLELFQSGLALETAGQLSIYDWRDDQLASLRALAGEAVEQATQLSD